MIYFNFTIRHPRWLDRFKTIKFWSRAPRNYKCWEIQLTKSEHIVRCEFQWSTQQDHAGIILELGLFGYEARFHYYDTRHWDYENQCWVIYKNGKAVLQK